MVEWIIAIWWQIHISIITLFFDMIGNLLSNRSSPFALAFFVSFAIDMLRHVYKQTFFKFETFVIELFHDIQVFP